MSKIIDAIRNNLDEKTYIKNRCNLKLYKSGGTTNEVVLSENSREMNDIKYFETKVRHSNLKVYMKNMAVLKTKKAILFGLPILLGTLSIVPWFNVGLKSKKTPVYKKIELNFDESGIIKDSSDEKKYAITFLKRDYVDENIISVSELTKSGNYATIYFGEGENSYQAEFRIYENGTWSYVTGDDEAYFNLTDKNTDLEALELDEKYSNLIKEAANIFIEESSFVYKKDEEIIRSLLENEKNDIYVEISTYEKIGEFELQYYHYHWMARIIMIIINCIYAYLLTVNFDELTHVKELYINGHELSEKEYDTIRLRYATLICKELFLQAEKERIGAINDILENHADNKDILSKYEKKLINNKDR